MANAKSCELYFILPVATWNICPWFNTRFDHPKFFFTLVPSALPFHDVFSYWVIVGNLVAYKPDRF